MGNPKGADMKPLEEDSVIPFLEAFLISSLINPKVFNKKGAEIPNKEVRSMSKEMNRREFMKASAATGAVLMTGSLPSAFAQELKPIKLLSPQLDGGKPLMQVLKDRKSTRWYAKKKIPLQVLSNLLWAAYGFNRPYTGHTAPHARQEIDIYVATADGVFFYDAMENLLNPVVAEDVRSLSGQQYPPPGLTGGYVGEAPVNLIYVWDGSGEKKSKYYSEEINLCLAFSNTGFISQNVYLYCASEGLVTVVRNWFDKPALEKKMKLRPEQYATLVQSVGYP